MNDQTTETNRDRVRRLLIDPLTRDGMRFPKDVASDQQRKRLDQMADDLGHMTDANLTRLRLCLASKGGGSARCFWPARVTVLGYSEIAQPRPIDDDPRLRSWFASAAGTKAAAEPGRLVAEYEFFTRHKHPPFSDQHQRLIKPVAEDYAGRAARIAERDDRGVTLAPDEAAWIVWYRNTHDKLMAWVRQVEGVA